MSLKFGLIGGYLGSKWAVFGQSAMTENYQLVAAGFEPETVGSPRPGGNHFSYILILLLSYDSVLTFVIKNFSLLTVINNYYCLLFFIFSILHRH